MHFAHTHERNNFGESFTYRGYDCNISYNGIRPHFNVDGENATTALDDFEVSPDRVGKFGGNSWRYSLMEAIDQHEGDDIDSDTYVPPQKREQLRSFAKRMFEKVFPAHGASYSQTHDVIEAADYSWPELKEMRSDEFYRQLETGENYGLDAGWAADGEIVETLVNAWEQSKDT